MLADGGDCLADLGALRDQVDSSEAVASDSTAWRVIDAVDPERLGRIRAARARARECAWAHGAVPGRDLLDIDSTLSTAHSDKQGARPTYKRGYGFHPMLCSWAARALAGVLRPGNAGANTAADHIGVLVERARPAARGGARGHRHPDPGAGRLRPAARTTSSMRSSRWSAPTRSAWRSTSGRGRRSSPFPSPPVSAAIRQDGGGQSARAAWVAELPRSSTCRGGRPDRGRSAAASAPHPGAQLSFADAEAIASRCCSPTRRAPGRPGGPPPRPRGGRGRDPGRQGRGAARTSLSRLRRQRRLAGAGARRPGPAFLGEVALSRATSPRRAQAAALPAAARGRADHPLGAADPASSAGALALGGRSARPPSRACARCPLRGSARAGSREVENRRREAHARPQKGPAVPGASRPPRGHSRRGKCCATTRRDPHVRPEVTAGACCTIRARHRLSHRLRPHGRAAFAALQLIALEDPCLTGPDQRMWARCARGQGGDAPPR